MRTYIMNKNNLFHGKNILCDLNVTSKKQLLQEMATQLLKSMELTETDITCRDIVLAAMERERLGSTGVGSGVALPHARIEGIKDVYAIFARLETPIEYDSIDERPVDLVTLLLAPKNSGGAHLRALAKVSRTLRKPDMRQRLRAAPNEDLILLLSSTELE